MGPYIEDIGSPLYYHDYILELHRMKNNKGIRLENDN